MFKLVNIEDSVSIEGEIVGYQFPDSPQDDWCLLKISVKQGDQLFEKIDPALEAKEIVDIYNWFKALAGNTLPSYATLTFVEPCISFNYLAYKSGRVRFSIILGHELKPGFELNQFKAPDKDWNIVLELSVIELGNVLESLKRTICSGLMLPDTSLREINYPAR